MVKKCRLNKIATRKIGGSWKDFDCGKYKAQILSFKEKSEYGIQNGKISKLWIQDKKNPQPFGIISYERGWDKGVKKKTPKEVKSIISELIKRYN